MTKQRRDGGFAARMLFAVPGDRSPWTDHDIPDEVDHQYRKVIEVLLNLEASDPPIHLTLTAEAQQPGGSFTTASAQRWLLRTPQGRSIWAPAIVKLRSTTLRFALGIALATAAEAGQVEAEQLREVDDQAMAAAAITLAEWFLHQSRHPRKLANRARRARGSNGPDRSPWWPHDGARVDASDTAVPDLHGREESPGRTGGCRQGCGSQSRPRTARRSRVRAQRPR